jgi:ferredoxin
MRRADNPVQPKSKRFGSPGDLVVVTPHEAVNETERRLCGIAAVSRPAVAEGMALQACRAATLLAPATEGHLGSDTASARVAWVHHRCAPGTTSGFAFELAASLSQDAIDHCLVAHDLARRIGAAGLCTFAPPPSGSLDRVALPDNALIQNFDSTQAEPVGPRAETDQSILTEARQAFRLVSELTGRPISTMTIDGAEDSEFALVASAASRSSAQQLAHALDGDGIRCRIICAHLVRPFPTAELSVAVKGVKRVLLIPSGDEFLEASRRAVVAGGQMATSVLLEPVESEAAIDAARRAFGFEARVNSGRKTERTATPFRLTARPVGGWAERFLLDAASRLATIDGIKLATKGDLLVVGHAPLNLAAEMPAHLALCAHPSYIETGLLLRIATGGTLVILSAGSLPDRWWDRLEPEIRTILVERQLRLHWVDLGAAQDVDLSDPEAVRAVALDGLLAGGQSDLANVLGLKIVDVHIPDSMTQLDLSALESARLAREPDFKTELRSLPRMPEEPNGTEEARWRDVLRRFHLTGVGAHCGAEPTLAEPLHPLVLDAIDTPVRQGFRYPLLVRLEATDNASVVVPFESWVAEMLEQPQVDGTRAEIVEQHLPLLSRAAGRVISRKPGPADPAPLVAEALREFERGFDLTDAGRATLGKETENLRLKLGTAAAGSALVGLDDKTLPCLHTAVLRRVRREHWNELREEIGSLAQRLEDLISIDDGHAPENFSAEALESTLGADAGQFINPQELAVNLQRRRGPKRLGESRRRRIECTLATLRDGLDDDAGIDLILIHPDSELALDALPGVREIVHPRGLGAAIGLFDGLAAGFTDLFRALRVARLEIDEAYDPDLHDEPLARLEWQGLSKDELLSLPRLVVLETDARLRGAGLGALSELLRSGRPIHVLVTQSTSEFRSAQSWQGLAGFHPGLGYLAVAHREAFIVQSSLVCPEPLVRDLQRMATSLRPGVALVAVPAWHATVPPWLQLLAAEQSRAMPYFSYDPEAGPNWAERFELDGNPQPRQPWPVHTVRYLGVDGHEATLEQAFSFAHAVALDPAYRGHFRIVVDAAWSAEQMELADYLAAPEAAVARKIPFIWVVHEGRIARALITRELAYASRDRLRAWHILQELAGTDNEYARRAAETARTDAKTKAEIDGKMLELAHDSELDQARSEAVRTAMGRLAARLVGVEETLQPMPEPILAAEPEAADASEEAEGVAVAQPPQEEVARAVIEEPYIDSALCTSCADCININPQLFKYDANKQAFISDVAQGTYAQLVKAAEKCPARCIHPGQPAAGDKTANDALIARAAKFN